MNSESSRATSTEKLSLLYGDGDFEKTICIATNCGEDTDCTAGTVGAAIAIKKGCRLALCRLSGAGNTPQVLMTVAVAVAIEEASK